MRALACLLTLAALLLPAQSLLAQGGHQGHGAPAAAPSPQPGPAAPAAAGLIQVPPERQRLIGLKTSQAQMVSMEKTIRATGKVDYDERRLVTVSPKIGGWIEELYVDFTGRQVKKGEPLLTIFSPDLLAAQEEYLLALRAREQLAKSGFAEVRDSGQALAQAARRRLKLLDISDGQIKALEQSGQAQRTLTLHAPYGGVVLERQAYKGMSIMPGQALFKLADLSVVWVSADVYEADLPQVRPGLWAVVSLPNLPEGDMRGKVVYINPFLDPKTRTGRVRLELANPQGLLKPEMYAQVQIYLDLGERLAIPESALVDTGARQMVFVAQGEGAFEAREVRAGLRAGEYVEVLGGLKAGERVVTSAGFLIDSEARFKEAVSGGGGGGAHAGHGK
ncbi:MAG: efflux RND transporter periplasmic adaptor subunit [Desulfarculus sp.]|nr:efflux RND transporter periplasmic adaptor subunit [Desulfarculus sp.]